MYILREITWGIISCDGIKTHCLMADTNLSPAQALRDTGSWLDNVLKQPQEAPDHFLLSHRPHNPAAI